MQITPHTSFDDPIVQALNDELVRQYGQLLPPAALVKVLGFRSAAALSQAVLRGSVQIPLLDLPNRRGRFALARDVAVWLGEQRRLALEAGLNRQSGES